MSKIQERINQIIIEEAHSGGIKVPKTVNPNDSLVSDIGFDSILILQFILRLEEEFEIDIDDDVISFELFEKVSNIVELLEEKLKEIEHIK